MNKQTKRKVFFKRFLLLLAVIFLIGLVIPENLKMPVEGASKSSYHPQSFWYYPWGTSITHKGVDIFARKGTPIHSATCGIVMYAGNMPGKGGNVVLVLGPKWRFHYYAHLDKVTTHIGTLVSHKSKIGTVGNSGNAAKTSPHLHYSIATPIPYPWNYDSKSKQGWMKMFYLNPIEALERTVK